MEYPEDNKKMKLVSFTQTYGPHRKELYGIHLRDKNLMALKTYFDHNIYSFHNVPINLREDFYNALPFTNKELMVYPKGSYGSCIRGLLRRLKELGATYLMFNQDDTFSNSNDDVHWEDLMYIVKSHKKDFLLSLSHYRGYFEDREPSISTPTLNLYNGTVNDFVQNGFWAMDDQPYICTIDVLEKMYNEEYLSGIDIWNMEMGLDRRWRETPVKPRHFTNRSLFINYNIVGSTLRREPHYRAKLKEKGLL